MEGCAQLSARWDTCGRPLVISRGLLLWEIQDWIAQQYGASCTLGGVYSRLSRWSTPRRGKLHWCWLDSLAGAQMGGGSG
jgi:hypothetical protein